MQTRKDSVGNYLVWWSDTKCPSVIPDFDLNRRNFLVVVVAATVICISHCHIAIFILMLVSIVVISSFWLLLGFLGKWWMDRCQIL